MAESFLQKFLESPLPYIGIFAMLGIAVLILAVLIITNGKSRG
jgi:hypothetical protein